MLIGVFVTSYAATAHLRPKRRAKALIEHAAQQMAARVSLADLMPIRRDPARAQEAEAVREADEILRAMLPELMASVPTWPID